MARIIDLVEPGKLTFLKHPDYFNKITNKYYKFIWDGCWLYTYDLCDRPLLAGNLTLFDDQ